MLWYQTDTHQEQEWGHSLYQRGISDSLCKWTSCPCRCCGEQSPAAPGDSVTQPCLHSLILSFLPCHSPFCTQRWFLIPVPFFFPVTASTPLNCSLLAFSIWPPKHLPIFSFEAQSPSSSPPQPSKHRSPTPSLPPPAPCPYLFPQALHRPSTSVASDCVSSHSQSDLP